VGRDFTAGGLALLRGETAFDAEAIEIDTVSAARLTLKRPTQSDWPETPPPLTYRGLPVHPARPDESHDLSSQFERLPNLLDNQTGRPAVTDRAGCPFAVKRHRWLLHARAEHSALRVFVYWLRGQQRAVWLPTHADDLTLVAPASGTVLTVEYVGYARYVVGQLGRRDIRIELSDGTMIHRRITGASEIDAGQEALQIDTDLPRAIVPAEVERISYLAPMRLADDDVEIEHLTDIEGASTATLTFRSVRDELEES
jgi:hypothetical protein